MPFDILHSFKGPLRERIPTAWSRWFCTGLRIDLIDFAD
jgi:hypothetical protein